MDGSDASTSQHGIGGFRDHGQIDRDRIALRYAVPLQHICETANVLVQLSVGDALGVVRVVPFPDNRGLIGTVGKMTIDAVHRHVGGAVLEPFDGDFAGIEAGILDLRIRLDPVNSLAVIIPESIRLRGGEGIHFAVL
jgi:hypothetical protein